MESEIRELLGAQLRDAYSAEKQALRWMQQAQRQTTSLELRNALNTHIEETSQQLERAEAALEQLDIRPGRNQCLAMRGLIDEAQHETEQFRNQGQSSSSSSSGNTQNNQGSILDLAIISSWQRVEHYEISAYGTAAALAEAIGERKIAELLQQTLEEERETDQRLTQITQSSILPALMQQKKSSSKSAS